MNSFLKFFARAKNNKRLKSPCARTNENRAKMLKADWFKNDITHVLINMVSPLGRVGISFFSSCNHSVYNYILYNKSMNTSPLCETWYVGYTNRHLFQRIDKHRLQSSAISRHLRPTHNTSSQDIQMNFSGLKKMPWKTRLSYPWDVIRQTAFKTLSQQTIWPCTS